MLMLANITSLIAAFGGGSIEHMLKVVIIIAALIAIVLIAVGAMGIKIPGWAIQIFWVVVIAVVAIIAINVIMGL